MPLPRARPATLAAGRAFLIAPIPSRRLQPEDLDAVEAFLDADDQDEAGGPALDAALRHPDWTTDPCQFTGSGSVAEEALAAVLLCALLFADEPVAALGRTAATSGDCDSIACLTGAFLGAAHGMDAWPAEWASRIECAEQLRSLSHTLADRSA